MPLAVLLLAIVGALACPSAHAAPVEPVYQGKPLGWWLTWWSTNREGPWMESGDTPRFRSADLSQCGPAFSEMGSAAIPFILERVREKDPSLAYSPWVARYFGYIGPDAIPQLTKALEDPNPAVRRAAALALESFALGSLSTNETARVFAKALDDEDDVVSCASVEALAKIGKAASNSVPGLIRSLQASLTDTNKSDDWKHIVRCGGAAILADIGPPASNAVPVLTNLLASGQFLHDMDAAIAIWRISSNTSTTLPVLLRYGERGYLKAIDTLGEMGPAAKAAVPFLLRNSMSTDPFYRRSASAALKRIDPEAAAKAGVK